MKYLFLALLLIPTMALAKPYKVIKSDSSITFSGTHAGNDFAGTFNDWIAEIDFDKNNLSDAHAIITFDLREAKTGNAMYDGTLPSPDWFDARNHPQAMYELTSVQENGDVYKAEGDLTIKGITKPVSFDFTLEGDNPTLMAASFSINRLDYNIGIESDADAQWVSEEIGINIKLTAQTE